MMTFGQLLKASRTKLKLTQRTIAEKLGVTTSAVSQWENDETTPDIKRLIDFGLLLNLEISEMMEAIDQTEGRLTRTEAATSPISKSAPLSSKIKVAQQRGGLPVFDTKAFPFETEGFDVDWPDGFEVIEQIIDVVHRPPRLAGREDVFALYVPILEMAPWRDAGDLIVVDVKRPPKIGDHVLVKMKDKSGRFRHVLRKLAGFSQSTLILHQYQPDFERRIKEAEVEDMLRIADWTELMLEI